MDIDSTSSEKRDAFNKLRFGSDYKDYIGVFQELSKSLRKSSLVKSSIEILVEKYSPSREAMEKINAVLSENAYSYIMKEEKIKTIIADDLKKVRRDDAQRENHTASMYHAQKPKKENFEIKKLGWPKYSPSRHELLSYYDGDTIVTSSWLGFIARTHKLSSRTARFFTKVVPIKQKNMWGYVRHMLSNVKNFETVDKKIVEGKEITTKSYNITGYNMLKLLYDFCLNGISSAEEHNKNEVNNPFSKSDIKGRVDPSNAYFESAVFVNDYFKIISNEENLSALFLTFNYLLMKENSLNQNSTVLNDLLSFFIGTFKKEGKTLKRTPSELEERVFAIPFAYLRRIEPKEKMIRHYIGSWSIEKTKFDVADDDSIKKSFISIIKENLSEREKINDEIFPTQMAVTYCEQGKKYLEDTAALSIDKHAEIYAEEQCSKAKIGIISKDKFLKDFKESYIKSADDDNNMFRFRYCAMEAFYRFFYKVIKGEKIDVQGDRLQVFSTNAFRQECEQFDKIINELSRYTTTEKSLSKNMLNNETELKTDPALSMIKHSSSLFFSIAKKLNYVLNEHRKAVSIVKSDKEGKSRIEKDEYILLECTGQRFKLIPGYNKVFYAPMSIVKNTLDLKTKNPLNGMKIDEGLAYITAFCYGYAYTLGHRDLCNLSVEEEGLEEKLENIDSRLSFFPESLVKECTSH